MPRISPFSIKLSADEQDILEEIVRAYTSPYMDVIRAKIVLYAAKGLSNKQISERLDTPRQIVSKWRKRFFDQGLQGLEELPRRGRPGKFSPLRRGRRKGSRV
jgi:transposase-like protein